MSDEPPRTNDDRLEEIVTILRRYDHREKRRAFWRSVNGIIRLVPLILSLYFMYYFYMNSAEIMNDLIKKSAEITTEAYTSKVQGGTENLSNTIKELLNQQ